MVRPTVRCIKRIGSLKIQKRLANQRLTETQAHKSMFPLSLPKNFWNFCKKKLKRRNKKMNIVFTNHAKYRINERKVSVINVRQAVKNPDNKKIDEYGMIVVTKKFGKRSLEVVYKIQSNNIIIITAYYI